MNHSLKNRQQDPTIRIETESSLAQSQIPKHQTIETTKTAIENNIGVKERLKCEQHPEQSVFTTD
jgi:hypothetical protein